MIKLFASRKFAWPRKTSSGFTLIELLLVIAIMGVLTTLSLALLRSANEQAAVSATQARIGRIEAILKAELERYEVRRLPMSRSVLANYIAANPWAQGVPLNVRLNALHKRIMQDLINCELPRPEVNGTAFQRKQDLGLFPSQQSPDVTFPNVTTGQLSFSAWLDARYPQPNAGRLSLELANYRSGAVASWADPRLNNPAFDHPAEYLYEILTRIDMDGVPAIETLGSSCFADTDSDGFLEVVDAWGEPLLWFIAQVDVADKTLLNELYQDVPVDWTQRLATGIPVDYMPVGYTGLDPTIPRDMQQIRATVYSKRLNDQGIFNTN